MKKIITIRKIFAFFLLLTPLALYAGDMQEPSNLQITIEGLEPGEALFTWHHPGNQYEFRYDDGEVYAQLGFQGDWNSVLGAVHHYDAVLNSVTWYLTGEGGPHYTVKVWVLGLDENGMPDRNNILYTAEDLPNVDNEWNAHAFPESLEVSEGFFIGLSYNGFLGLAIDDGVGEPWEFAENTQFGVFDITDPDFEFSCISAWGLANNYLLRVYGINQGEVGFDKQLPLSGGSPAPLAILLDKPVDAGAPLIPHAGQKAFEGFGIYLNDDLVAEDIEENEYLFTGLETGEYTAGVQAVYATGTSDIASIDFAIEATETFEVTFEVDLTKAIEFELFVSFDPYEHHIFITGDMLDWAEPGTLPDEQIMDKISDDPLVYAKTFYLEAGTYEYKYFSDAIGEGWDGGEWAGDPNRVIVVDGDMTVENTYGPDDIQVIETDDLAISLYPNPASNIIRVESSERISELRIIDMLGQVVYNAPVNDVRHQVNVSGLNAGIYFIQLTAGTEIATQKVQVSR